MFQYREDAEKVMRALKVRLAKFGLELAEDKTRIVPIGRFNRGKSEFDFLGFTFFDAVSRKGFYKLGIRSSSKKIASKRAGIKQWLKSRMHQPMVETLKTIDRKLRGHYNYYGVNGNFRALQKYEDYLRLCTLMMLRRRSQRKKITEKKFSELWELFVSPPRITVQIWGQ